MKKDALKLLGVIVAIFLISITFCGCLSTEVEDKNFDIDFESDAVNLLDCNIEFKKNKQNIITEITVDGVIQNKLDKRINVLLTSEFYDVNNIYLGEKTFRIFGLLEKNGLKDTTTFTIIYKEENANQVEHVKLFATEF